MIEKTLLLQNGKWLSLGNSLNGILVLSVWCYSTLTLLVGREERHLAYEKVGISVLVWFLDWSYICHHCHFCHLML